MFITHLEGHPYKAWNLTPADVGFIAENSLNQIRFRYLINPIIIFYEKYSFGSPWKKPQKNLHTQNRLPSSALPNCCKAYMLLANQDNLPCTVIHAPSGNVPFLSFHAHSISVPPILQSLPYLRS